MKNRPPKRHYQYVQHSSKMRCCLLNPKTSSLTRKLWPAITLKATIMASASLEAGVGNLWPAEQMWHV